MKFVPIGFVFSGCIAFFVVLNGLSACSTSETSAKTDARSETDCLVASGESKCSAPICSDGSATSEGCSGGVGVPDAGPNKDANPGTNPSASTSSVGQLYLDWDEVSLITQHAGAYSWEVLQSYMREHVNIAQLKAANPDMRLFMYFETAGAYAEPSDTTWPSGMPYQWVRANHPDWIVKSASGDDITFWGGDLHLYDVGNPAYQDEWATRAIQYAQSGGFHGIFGDDVNMGESFRSSWSAVPSKYGSDVAWTRAVESFLQNVSPKLKAAGISFVPNVASAWNSDRPTQVRWAKLAGGYGREHYQSWQRDTDLLGGADWAWMAALHRDVVAAGVPFYAFPHGGGAQAADKMRYTRCSFLLWHEPALGGFAYSTGGGPNTGADPYHAAWTFDLGAPSGPAVQASSGVWSRQFARGKIVVDSNAKTATVQ